MLTHKKKLFRNITLFALALSLVQTCWAGFLSEQSKGALDEGAKNELISLNTETPDLALKQSITPSSYSFNDYSSPESMATVSKVKLDNGVGITDSTKRITLSLRDSDVRQVLRMLADKAGLNIAFHESVEGTITLDLNNVTINEAFLLVLRSCQLNYVKEGKNIIVATISEYKNLGLGKDVLTVIPIKYVEAPAVAKFLNSNIFSAKMTGVSNKQVASANPRSNEVMIFGTENDANVAERVIQQLDKKPMLSTFKLKHTTPKEMASLVCDTLIPSKEALDNAGQQAQSTETQVDTGDVDTDSEATDIQAVKLGGGYIACRGAIADTSGTQTGNATDDSSIVASFVAPPLTVTFSPDLALVSVYGGSVQQVQMIKDFIEKNDIPQPMAYIELAVIELNEDGSKEFSNQWNMWTPFLSLGFSTTEGVKTNPSHPVIFGPDTPAGGAKYSGSSVLTYTLKYLIKNSKGRILTNPKLMVTNGQKSTIDLTSDYVKSTSTEMGTNSTGTTSNPIVTRTYDIGSDEGLKIEIIPFISQDGYVSMNIQPNFSSQKQRLTSTDSNNNEIIEATLLQRRNLKLSNLRIKDGETLVIAGLIKEDEKQNVTKVPVLGDLPLIGAFFRNSVKKLSKEELVIMITPHIIYSEEQISEIKTIDL